MRTIVIGDVHGCYHTLISLLEKVGYDKDTDKLILLGDYIDRGKYSCEVVEYLIKLQREAKECICLMGNHEYMAITDRNLWKQNGGNKTISSYFRNKLSPNTHFWWFRQLPLYHETDNYIFCHAGLSYPKLKDNSMDDILWGRDWIEEQPERNEKQVVFGHTYSTDLMYITKNGSFGIDTACVYGYQLCALVIYDNNTSIRTYYENKHILD